MEQQKSSGEQIKINIGLERYKKEIAPRTDDYYEKNGEEIPNWSKSRMRS